MKKILVPTDFSDCAQNATDIAIEIAKRHGAQLHFYHFMTVPIDWIHLDFAQNTVYPDMSEELERVKGELQKLVIYAESHGLQAVQHMDFDNAPQAVTKYAHENDISMIVMGSHGAKGVKEFFIGSNAQMVVRNSEIPVLIVKEKLTNLDIPNIVFVSDFKDEMMKPFQKVVEFAEMLNAKIHLLYINTPSEFMRSWVIEERMEGFRALASDRLEAARIINSLTFEEGFEKYCDMNVTGLLAIATHHRRGLSRAFLGSLTETVVNRVKVPVVSFPI